MELVPPGSPLKPSSLGTIRLGPFTSTPSSTTLFRVTSPSSSTASASRPCPMLSMTCGSSSQTVLSSSTSFVASATSTTLTGCISGVAAPSPPSWRSALTCSWRSSPTPTSLQGQPRLLSLPPGQALRRLLPRHLDLLAPRRHIHCFHYCLFPRIKGSQEGNPSSPGQHPQLHFPSAQQGRCQAGSHPIKNTMFSMFKLHNFGGTKTSSSSIAKEIADTITRQGFTTDYQ